MKTLADLCLACASVAVIMLVSRQLQAPTTVVVWDAGQYYRMVGQFAAGRTPYAESPYVFRVAVPWLASKMSPRDPARAFFFVNLASAFAIAILLVLWLRAWGIAGWTSTAMVTLVAAAWHGPMRYPFYNPGYVDPPFLALLLIGLLLIHRIARSYSAGLVVLLALLSAVGAFVRETMFLVPLCLLLVNDPVGAWLGRRRRTQAVPGWALALPLIACTAAIAVTHRIVVVDTTERASMLQAAFQWIHKAPDSYVMGWLTAFGPILAVVVFDWRRAVRLLADHEWLAALVAGCLALSFVGGSDTERFAFWSLPVVYLLIARAIERHADVLRHAWLMVALIVSQAVSARVFWGIPDPRAESVVALTLNVGWRARVYGLLDRLFVIDSFHFNLWSSFGSRPFRLLRVGVYLVAIAALTWSMHRRAVASNREISLGALGRPGHGAEDVGVTE